MIVRESDQSYYLFAVWGSCRAGDRNAALEEFTTREEADAAIVELLNDHPDATWKLVHGEEVKRG